MKLDTIQADYRQREEARIKEQKERDEARIKEQNERDEKQNNFND